MNYFLELKIFGEDSVVLLRPEAVVAVERLEGAEFELVISRTGEKYEVEKGQFVPNKLINKTTHAGMRVL
jgi:hypothetical protein